MKEIPLTKGKVALVDDEDYDYLMQWKWYAKNDKKDTWYAFRSSYSKNSHHTICITIGMHREIMGLKKGNKLQVDHINHNGLDNQKKNLRVCTHTQNRQNARFYKNNTSGVKGVSFEPCSKKWRARIWFDGKFKSLGRYKSKQEAVEAYDEATKKYHGDFSCPNNI